MRTEFTLFRKAENAVLFTRFCTKCGTIMDVKAVDAKRHCFWDGGRQFFVKLECPNKKYFLDGHDRHYYHEGTLHPKKLFTMRVLSALGYKSYP